MPVYFHSTLHERFQCAGREVLVTVSGFHVDTGKPLIDVSWSGRPDRLSPEDHAAFDAGKRAAVATLKARLAELQGATT